jgi:hypothetical protein
MKRTVFVWIPWLLTAASSATAAWLWKSQHSLATENVSLRTRLETPLTPPPQLPVVQRPQPIGSAATADARPRSPQDGPPMSAEEQAKRAQIEKAREALRQKESDTRFAAKVHLLKTRLNLTSEQEQLAAASLQKARDLRKTARDGFKPGQPPDFALMEKMMRSDSGAAEEIRAQLSPDQLQEFDVIQQEERKDRAETQANQRLSDMQQYLKMSEEQKDAVFNVLSQQALASDLENQPPAKDFEEIKARIEASNAAQREQLAQILDPVQLKSYDELNTTRTELMQLGPGGFGGGFGGGPGRGGPPGR